MNIKELTKDELHEIPMVEIAFEVMNKKGEPYNYYDLFKELSTLKGLSKAEEQVRIAKLYTDINLDGRFHSLGNNEWGLKKWYPLDQTNEEVTTPGEQPEQEKVEDKVDITVNFDDFEEEYEDLEDALDEVSGEDDEEEEDDETSDIDLDGEDDVEEDEDEDFDDDDDE